MCGVDALLQLFCYVCLDCVLVSFSWLFVSSFPEQPPSPHSCKQNWGWLLMVMGWRKTKSKTSRGDVKVWIFFFLFTSLGSFHIFIPNNIMWKAACFFVFLTTWAYQPAVFPQAHSMPGLWPAGGSATLVGYARECYQLTPWPRKLRLYPIDGSWLVWSSPGCLKPTANQFSLTSSSRVANRLS